MLRMSFGLCHKSLHLSRGHQFAFSVIKRNISDIISEVPKEHTKDDISLSDKELAKMIKVTHNPDGRSVCKLGDHTSEEIPQIFFSEKNQTKLPNEDLWQDESFESSYVLELTEDDFQHSQSSYHDNFKQSSSLSDGINEKSELLPELFEDETLFNTSTVSDFSAVSDNTATQPVVQDNSTGKKSVGIVQSGSSKKKKKTKHMLKSDTGNLRAKNDAIKGVQKEEIKQKLLSDTELSTKKTVKSGLSTTHSSSLKTKLNMEKSCKHSDAQYKESAADVLNKQYMQTLISYINVCINTNMIARAHKAFHVFCSKKSRKYAITDIEVYDALLAGWAQKGQMKTVKALFGLIKKHGFSPTLQSYASYLECLARNNMHCHPEVKSILSSLEQDGFHLEDLFTKCKFTGDQCEKLIDIISSVKPDFVALRTVMSQGYSCKLLEKLNSRSHKSCQATQPQNGFLSKKLLNEFAVSQMGMEDQCIVEIKSVNAVTDVSKRVMSKREEVKKHEVMWHRNLSTVFMSNLHNYRNKAKTEKKCLSLEPYLISVDSKIIVDIMLKEIRFLAENCENFSPNVKVLHHEIGVKVMNHYFVNLKKKNKIVDKMLHIYNKYSEYLVSPELMSKYSSREYWELLKFQEYKGPTIDTADVRWSYHTLCEVGKFLYHVIFESTGFNFKIDASISSKICLMPAFYILPVNAGTHLIHQVRVHPRVSQMYREAELEHLYFDVSLMPMMCPPRPWNHINAGGSLITHTPFIRLPSFAPQMNLIYGKIPSRQLFPCFDSLNILSLCPWIINKPMLDLVITLFRNNGCEELDIPVNPKCLAPPSEVAKKAVGKKSVAAKEHLKKKSEMASLWFDCLYKLTIANYFRDKIFWFPHNLDFRGRVYPTPPHFNHLGSDVVRSILLFAEGKPLGKNGLNWLKIHLINLTGLKKREPLSERLKFANVMMPEILDSADKPFTGKQWWKNSDEPWQTLACCKEVASAVRSPDPSNYISYFPVHQDGSCNGLQHYAALGRDEFGACEVNLHPADSPHDVYSSVAALVEKERSKDAADGSEIACALDGFVQRKVVKQTVMTYVYGVTPFGAKLQILKQLKDIPGFPQTHCKDAIRYLSNKIFSSIEEMFTATQQIQNWFTDCAEVITKVLGKPVEWITPLGLPVIQPYHREVSVRGPSDFFLLNKEFPTPYKSTFEAYQRPNIMKQKNAFAPNFIHSLDSSHMMLTALFCRREGITFVSVHDCFWTHPCTVEVMNRICREQFVAMHSEPILEQLSEYFSKRYLHQHETVPQDSHHHKQFAKLKTVLTNVPNRGSFELSKVLTSVYFFS